MAKPAPNPIDIQEFQFKLHCHLKIFNNQDLSFFANPCSLLACASQYGLIFVGTNTPAFQVIQINSIEKYSESGYHQRLIQLPSSPKHLAVNCDGTTLAVITISNGFPLVILYDVASFTKQAVTIIRQLPLSMTPDVNILEISWNPTIPNIFSVCKDDGSLGVYELKETTVDRNELPVEAQAISMSWSPKGKQIAVGSRYGKITQYKPDLKAMKVINAPPLEGTQHVIALQWISNYQFIAVYRPPDPDSNASVIVIDSPKTGEAVYTNYEDICYGYGNGRAPQFYTIYQSVWNVLMVASSNSIEVGVMGCQGEQWTQWILPDTARAELPLTRSKQESLPIGLALDVAATEPVVWGETTLPAVPFLLVLSHEGLLCCFRVMNMKNDMQNICRSPTKLTDNTGLNQFVLASEVKDTGSILVPGTQPIKPVATQAELFIKQPVAETIIKPSDVIVKPPKPVQMTTFIKPLPSVAPLPVTPVAEHSPLVMSPITSVAPVQLNESNTIQKEADMLIANLIREECESLETELKSLLHKSGSIKIDLGTDAEAVELIQETDMLHDFLTEVVETNTAQSTEIYALKQALIQTWAWYEDARFRLAQTRDTTLEALIRLQQLDPVSQRYLTETKQMSYYLDSQIKQAGQVLDDQWSNFQDKCKKIIRTKVPTMETIYQTMVRHSIILEKQKYILKDIANRNKSLRSRLSRPSLLTCLNSVDLLEKSLKRLQLEPEQHFLEAQYEMVLQKQKRFTQAKNNKLTTLLKNRDVTNVKINKPHLSNITTNLQSLLQSSPRIKKSVEASIIGAGLSPITTKPIALWSSTFVQSTPKATYVGAHQNTPTSISSTTFIPSQSKLTFTPASQSNLTSAFVPTTQLAFSFTNKSVTASAATPTFGSPSLFTFGASMEPTKTTTTSKVIPSSTTPLLPPATSASVFGTTTTPLVSKSTPLATFNFQTNTPSTTFSTKVVDNKPTFNFTSSGTTSIFSPTTTTSPSWFIKTTDTTTSPSVNATSISTPPKISYEIVSSPNAITNLESALNLPNRSVKITIVSPVSSTQSNSLFTNSALSFSPAKTTSAGTTTFSETKRTTTDGLDLSTNTSSSIFSNTNTVAPFLSFTKSETTPTITSSPAVTTSIFMEKPANKPIFGMTTNTSSLFTATSVGVTKSSIDFNAIPTTSPVIFTSTPLTQTSIFDPKPATFFGPAPTTVTSVAGITTSTSPVTTQSSIISTTSTTSDNKISGTPSTTSSLFQSLISTVTQSPSATSTSTSVQSTFGKLGDTISSPSTTQSIFGTQPKPTFGSAFGPTTTTASFAFGTAVTSNTNLFTSTTTTAGGSLFGSAPTTTTSLFGTPISSPMTSSSIFGTQATQSGSIFGSTTAFGTPTTTSSIFGSSPFANTGSSVFGATTTSTPFGATTTATPFGTTTTANPFGATNTTKPFGPTTAAPFGTTTTASLFGATASTPFGATTTAAPFGTSSTGSIFGQQSTFGGSSVFGSPVATSTNSVFGGVPQSSANSEFSSTGFSKPFSFTLPPTSTSSGSFGFGDLNMGSSNSSFSGQTANPFSKPFAQEQKPFGGGSLFGTPSTSTTSIFGSGSTSTFGFGSASGFGSPAFGQQTTFGQSSAFGSPTQSGGPFSGGNQSVAQSGFGGFGQQMSKDGFGATPAFGGSPSGFGSAPTFGSAAYNSSFGSPNKAFGDSSNSSPVSGVFGSPPQQNSTFSNLATQNTIGFGALAQQSPQSQPSQPSFSGGSSFSTWR